MTNTNTIEARLIKIEQTMAEVNRRFTLGDLIDGFGFEHMMATHLADMGDTQQAIANLKNLQVQIAQEISNLEAEIGE